MDFLNSHFKHLVSLVGHLSWPLTVAVFVYLVRQPIRRVIDSLADRIRDPRSQLAISKEGVEIKTMVEARLESFELDQEQTKSLALQALRIDDDGEASEISNGTTLPQELIQLAEEYLKISHPDWTERVREKDAAARRMADYVITKGISRDLLAGQHHEGIILALATTIHTLPQKGDIGRIIRVADEVNRLHVKYRVVLALGRLSDRKLTSPDDDERALEVLKVYKRDADASLERRISYTEKAIQESLKNR